MNQVVISSLPKNFLSRIFRHCMGKNNTPYFANNCFKGVLYFDENTARKFAETMGYSWKGWTNEDRFHHQTAYCFEGGLGITASVNGEQKTELDVSEIETKIHDIELSAMLPQIKDDEIIVLMGSVDKGSEAFALDDFKGDFSVDELIVSLDAFDSFNFDSLLITGMTYADKEMQRVTGRSKGRNMISPLLFSANGDELDLYDFIE
ncbi:MAG: hypothetical protein SVS15_03420 [Thermodesulfobacteriota bacterium]|nr:hypothetical protein [Thermodesulfobacteriota bacterium]